jgi:XisI protein
MASLERYRQYIQEVIQQHSSRQPAYGEVEVQCIFDTERDHYQLVHAGWHKNRRKYGCLIHMDLKEGKIWIQHDGTEIGVANELVELGVPKDDIVLAYQPPYKRAYTTFAVS